MAFFRVALDTDDVAAFHDHRPVRVFGVRRDDGVILRLADVTMF
jgi:hypothetical protein